MNMLLKYQDETLYNSHDQHQKLGTQSSNISYVVSYISSTHGQRAIFQDKKGNKLLLEAGMVVSQGGLISTNDQRIEIRATSGITFRLGENSEFSVERTIAGVIPVYYGKVYIFGRSLNNFIDGGKYRTSCYMSKMSIIDVIVMNISEVADVYYSLNGETIIEEYDETGKRFPLFISGEFNVTELKKYEDKPMKKRYQVINQRELTNSEISKLYEYFVNPLNWR